MDIQQIYKPVEADLLRVKETLRKAGAAEGASGHEHMAEMLEHVLDVGGKHVRPAITLLASKFHPHDDKLPVLMGTAVELLHIATLVHDDTIDKAEVRRGRPTVSSLWGKDVALLVGDYIFAKSATYVCDTQNVRVIRTFAETIMELSAGQLKEYMAAYDWQQTRDHYWKRIFGKTASLFSTAAETGAILGDAPENEVQALKSYGYNLGMAFQVIDDILDFEGSQTVVGKPVGNDLAQGTLTLPAIVFMERHPKDESIKAFFEDNGNQEKCQVAIDKIREASNMAEAHRIANGLCDTAKNALNILPISPARKSLLTLADYVCDRNL